MKAKAQGTTITIYVVASIVISVITLIAITTVFALRPNEDNTTMVAAIIGFATPTIMSLLALLQRENHLAMNSRLDQLLESTNKLARAEGRAEGRNE